MQNATNAVLDRIATVCGLRSDYALAKAFRSPTQRIYNYRAGRSQMDDAVAIEAAKLAGIDPVPLLMELQAERSKSPEARERLLRAANLLKQQHAA